MFCSDFRYSGTTTCSSVLIHSIVVVSPFIVAYDGITIISNTTVAVISK
ncbi:MAG: hypothetical protein LBT10_05475 [Methanobrevibacter sp.]|nr:hypothetical protein [Methanobrevibacter sp.]